jgi:LemA protein
VKGALIGVVILVGIGVAAAGKFMNVRHDLVAQREAMNAQWSQVDVALGRRADLVPGMVEMVKRYEKDAPGVFQDLTSARAVLGANRTPPEKIQANDQLSNALGRLLVISENYPKLRSNENFLRLQDEIAGTENRIAVERRKYNEALERYNAQIQMFPNNVVAGVSGFARNDAYFQTDAGARIAPKE